MPPVDGYDYDLVVIGAGLSGLSLVCWLMDLAEHQGRPIPRVCLLEPRQTYSNDRTWCFWDAGPNPFAELIRHRWQHWQVSYRNEVVTQSSQSAPYAMLAAGDVYQYAQQRIEACSAITLRLGTGVDHVRECNEGVEISTGSDRCFTRSVIDTRPPSIDRSRLHDGFWQVFSGVELLCPDHGLDPGTARLMDMQDSSKHLRFVYVLPFSEDRLLVEWTEFDPTGSVSDCREKLADWLAASALRNGEILRTESGSLPMFPIKPLDESHRRRNAGVAAGWMRSATGYHFATCQRTSKRLAEQILAAAENGDWSLNRLQPRAGWLDWMDKIFLRALRQNPAAAPQWFLAMFNKTSAEQMARFMNDQPRLSDAFTIAAALPKTPFLKALFHG